MSHMNVDPHAAEFFAERMMGMLNAAAMMLMVSIGHRTGLFDTMAAMPPSTAAEIAAKAGLAERYVREWLAALVTGRILTYDERTGTYHLPRAHAASLTRAASPNNLAVMAQLIPFLGGIEDRLLDCFHTGGGLRYSAYAPRYHEILAEDSAQTVVTHLIDEILPLAPELVERLRRGIDVLDVGCGSGGAVVAMAEAFPRSRFTGYDICCQAVAAGRAAAARFGSRVRFLRQDAAAMPDHEAYDLITAFDAIHDQADPEGVLARTYAALRPGGVFLIQDIAAGSRLQDNLDHPMAPLLYAVSTMHSTCVSLGYGGPGLGMMWGRERALAMLYDAGFEQVSVHQLPHDLANEYYVAVKPADDG